MSSASSTSSNPEFRKNLKELGDRLRKAREEEKDKENGYPKARAEQVKKIKEDISKAYEFMRNIPGISPIKIVENVEKAKEIYDEAQSYGACKQKHGAPLACAAAVAAKHAAQAGMHAAGAYMGYQAMEQAQKTPAAAAACFAAGYVLNSEAENVGKSVYTAVLQACLPPPPPPKQMQCYEFNPGAGWERGAGGWYRNLGFGAVEKMGFCGGGVTYCSRSDLGVPSSFGGVQLSNAGMNDVFAKVSAQNSSNASVTPLEDVVGFDAKERGLVYRGVRYVVPSCSLEDMATACLLTFFLGYADVGVSMDPIPGTDRFAMVYKPSILSRMHFGRTLMKADVILKEYLCKMYSDYRVDLYHANGRHLDPSKVRVWFEPRNLQIVVSKDNFFGVVVSDVSLVYNKAEAQDPCAQKFVDYMNEHQQEMLDRHPEFHAVHAYASATMLCKLLSVSSGNTIDSTLSDWIQSNVYVCDDEAPATSSISDIMRNVLGHNVCMLKGGVSLMSRAMLLSVPWRKPPTGVDRLQGVRVCDRCKYCIESYMEASVAQKDDGTGPHVICGHCRKELGGILYQCVYEGVGSMLEQEEGEEEDKAAQFMISELRKREPLIKLVIPSLMSVKNVEQAKALLAIHLKTLKIANANLSVHLEHEKDKPAIMKWGIWVYNTK